MSDLSWIKPGKVAWDWWNDWNLDGVDFVTGVNNPTYKAYIDFASANGIEYVILDEGWAVNLQADLMQVVKEIDLKELVDYAASKNVGIIFGPVIMHSSVIWKCVPSLCRNGSKGVQSGLYGP